VTKKKKELAVPRDLTLESFRKEYKWEPKWIIKAGVIDTPSITRMTEVKMKDPIMNMLCYMMTGKDLDDL